MTSLPASAGRGSRKRSWKAKGGRQPYLSRTTKPETAGFPTGTTGVTRGKESERVPEIAGAGGCCESVAPDRPRAWSARPQHHGILQGVQRADAEGRKEHPDPGDHHHLRGPFLHLRDEDAADVLLPQAGRKNPVRVEGPGPRQGRQGDPRPGARDRREEDEGSQLRHYRVGHEDGRGLRPLDGSGSCGVTGHGNRKTFEEGA